MWSPEELNVSFALINSLQIETFLNFVFFIPLGEDFHLLI